MAQHKVTITRLPKCEIGNADVVFAIRRNGKQFGTITISEGAIEWFPKRNSIPYRLRWYHFDKAIRAYHGE